MDPRSALRVELSDRFLAATRTSSRPPQGSRQDRQEEAGAFAGSRARDSLDRD